MSERSLVTNLRVNANEAITPLREYAKAAGASDAALSAMAEKSAESIESLAEKGGRAFNKLAETGKVSEAAFDGFLRTVGNLREEVIEKFGSIENAPEPFQRAVQSAEQYLRDMRAEMTQAAQETAALRTEFTSASAAATELANAEARATSEAAELRAQQEASADLAAKAAEKYADVTDRIEEIAKASDKTSDEQLADLKEVADELADSEKAYRKLKDGGVQALEAIRPAAEKVERAIKDLSASAATENTKIRDATLNTERAFASLAAQIKNNPKEAVEQLPKAAGAVVQLRRAIEEARAAGGPIDPGAVAELKRFESQLEKTKVEIGSLKREIDQSTAGVTNATGAWGGMGSIVDQVAGKFGALGAGVVGGVMALKEGWAVGTEIAKAIGTDFRAMDQAVASFTERAKLLNPAMLDWITGAGSFEAVRAAATLSRAELAGYNSAVLAGVSDIGELSAKTAEFNAIHDAHAKILAEGSEGQRLATQAKREGAGVLSEYITSLDLATQAADAHNKLVAVGAEGERLWNEIREKGKGTLVDLLIAIDDQKTAIDELLSKTKEEIAAERDLQAALNDTVAAKTKKLALEKQQVDLVAQQEKVEDGLTATMRTRLAEISASMVVKEGREIPLTRLQISQLEQLIPATIGLTDAERASMQTLIDKLKTVEKMSQYEREAIAREIQYKLAINTSAQADEAHRVVLDAKTGKYVNAAAATGKLSEEQIRATDGSAKLEGGLGRLGGTAKTVETSARGAGEGLRGVAKEIEAANGSTERLATANVKAKTAIDQMADSVANVKPEQLAIPPATIESLAAYDRELASIAKNLESIVNLRAEAVASLEAVGAAATKATGGGGAGGL